MLATYAGGGPDVDIIIGFKELEYKEGPWRYKDSYSGFFQSWGRETVWYKKRPFWTQIYGGGMEPKFYGNKNFTHETFTFLKKAMAAGDKSKRFQPRGPKSFTLGSWSYQSTLKGNIKKFQGSEKILYKDKVVFTHNFLGGLFIPSK